MSTPSGGDPGPAHPGPADPVQLSVPALLDGVRVDRAVAMLTGVSRALAAELVAAGRVALDGAPVTTRSTPLAEGSMLSVDLPGDRGPAVEPEPDVVFDVVYADEHVAVVDKPAGLVVHPGAGIVRGTLAGGLLARFPDLADLVAAGVGEADRPGIVHRLDRGTSGLLAVARTEAAYESLTAQLAARSVDRRYLALVAGEVVDDRGVVDAPIGRSTRTPTRMTVSSQGRPARTAYTVRRRFGGPAPATLLSLALESGRTHQIRVHMAAIGHPVVGDDRYGSGGRLARGGTPWGLTEGRVFLHACLLGFEHPATGAHREWVSPLPADLEEALAGAGPGVPSPEDAPR